DAGWKERDARVLVYRIGPERFTDRVLLAWTRAPADAADAAWLRIATVPRRWAAPAFPLKAAAFVRRGLQKGPRLGAALRAAEEAWIAADFPADKQVLDEIAEAAAARARAGGCRLAPGPAEAGAGPRPR